VLDAAPSQLREVAGVGPKLAARIRAARDEVDVDAELATCREHNIEVIGDDEPEYPAALREIHDPPPFLFLSGELLPRDALAIAIVGSRHCTPYGRRQAERLAGSLSRAGLTVVSGLARGTDAAAHRGALEANGRTLAVLGSGLLNVYPPEHRELAFDVKQQGALLSELPPHCGPSGGTFPQRNRLISGMTLGVVVIEAAERSGALITARHAMEQGREVFALPGPVDSRMSRGCHRLLRDGAKLVETADDVLEELGPLCAPADTNDGEVIRHPAELALNDVERNILQAIDVRPTLVDQVAETTGLPVHRVLSTLSVLEMRHLIRRVSASQVMRS